MMRLIIADTDHGRSMAYLVDRTSFTKCQGSTQSEQSLLQLNFKHLQPVKNSHGSLVVMSEAGWRKFAKAMNARFCKQSSDFIFWSTPVLAS